MRFRYLTAVALALASGVFALDGQIGIHDPSTIIQCDGKYYTYGTGGGGLVSHDGWTWSRGASRPGGGVAPDVIHIGDRYYLYYSTSSKQPQADVHMIWNKTLDPNSPDFKWEEGGIVASSDGTYRIMPKAVPNSGESLALSAVGSSFATLARFKAGSDKQRWNLKTP